MASHGVARSARVPRSQEQRDQDVEKIRKYRNLEDQARFRMAGRQLDNDTFLLTSRLLRVNPEYYTIWNLRRRCLDSGILSEPSPAPVVSSPLHLPQTAPNVDSNDSYSDTTASKLCPDASSRSLQDEIERTIRSELEFTVPLLIEFPKCYWIWNHRLWILEKATQKLLIDAARAIWEEELGLISKMLLKDRRNFHAWGYRRRVVAQLESADLAGQSAVEAEFAYTTGATRDDLSNFSAWHNRSQLIPRLLQERGAGIAARKEFLDTELGIAREALNVGPEDQSLWYYHDYLCSNLVKSSGTSAIVPQMPVTERKKYILDEITNIRELAEDYEDVKWIYEALIKYTLAICQLDGRSTRDEERREISSWLAKLRELDPRRSGRWDDFEAQLDLA